MILDRAVGIDLGTTNSEISFLLPSEREILIFEDNFGRKTVPSAVAWDEEKKAFLVGRPARARRGRPSGPVESIKRSMGHATRVKVGPHELGPEEVSAQILAELRRSMQTYVAARLGEGFDLRVRRAVITVPAYFDTPQVEATRKAGELAELDVIGILQEPTSAAVYHTFKHKIAGGNFLVYDLGGGTFDVSILRCVGGEYQVLAIDGDNYLGGDDFDRRFAERLRGRLSDRGFKLDLDPRQSAEDRARFDRLVHVAQEIKEQLSTSDVLSFSRQDLLVDQDGEQVSLDADIGRDEYDASIVDLVDRTIACSEAALGQAKERAGIGIEDIDHVILVGGSTRVPLVQRRVQEVLGNRTKTQRVLADDVDTCVALGAAVHAAQLGGLRLTDEATRTSVLVTSPLVRSGQKMRLAFKVEGRPEGAERAIVRSGGTDLAAADLPTSADDTLRLDVVPEDPGDVEAEIALVDRAGETVGKVPVALYQGEARPRASALSRATVLPKELAIEIVRGGRRERFVLVARGTGLPAETKHTFYTADQSGAVVLRLLQGRLPIKTIAVEVARDLPIGSSVDLTLTCDEAMRIDARASISGQDVWARVEVPSGDRFDDHAAVEQLLADAETAKRNVWGQNGEAFRAEVDRLAAGIREVAGIDPAKLHALCLSLRRILDEVQGDPSDPLTPSMHLFEHELDGLRRVVYRSGGSLMGLDRTEWETRIADLEERAHAAYAAVDATAWRRTFNEVQALRETAIQEEFSSRRLDDPSYVRQHLAALAYHRTRTERRLHDFITSPTPELGALQIAERNRLLGELAQRVDAAVPETEVPDQGDLNALRRRIDQAFDELDRIDAAVERLPSIGLVADRGGSGGGTSGNPRAS